MELHVFLAVLAAAAFHAGWNAMLKLRLEPLLALSLIAAACGFVSAPLLPVSGLPAPGAWIYILASLAIHLVYYVALAEAYRTGDLGQVYPIARGTAPLITALGAWAWLGEELGSTGWTGIVILASGIILLSLRSGAEKFDVRAVGFAFLTALSIAAYTLADGSGAREGGTTFAYIVWLFVLDGVMMLTFGLLKFRGVFISEMRRSWRLILGGGVLSAAAYAIALWAMTQAPIALVAALRETSVLFAAAIGVMFLGEPIRLLRLLAAALVLGGMFLLRLR
jgi:drug/metabolite transporter (DMT)-like permease